jgi:dephospho-CoA kinase
VNNKIYVVGLTGQSGAGKSTVSEVLRAHKIDVIDCDGVARDVVEKEKNCLADLALEFTIAILNADGSLNRKRLGAMVFGNPERLKKLNEIIFPYIRREVDRKVAELEKQGRPIAVLDAPTLFDSGGDAACDYIVSVISPEKDRLNRIMVRDHLTDDEARRRLKSQHDDRFFIERSQHVITNNATYEDLRIKALELVERLIRRAETVRNKQTTPTSDTKPKGDH